MVKEGVNHVIFVQKSSQRDLMRPSRLCKSVCAPDVSAGHALLCGPGGNGVNLALSPTTEDKITGLLEEIFGPDSLSWETQKGNFEVGIVLSAEMVRFKYGVILPPASLCRRVQYSPTPKGRASLLAQLAEPPSGDEHRPLIPLVNTDDYDKRLQQWLQGGPLAKLYGSPHSRVYHVRLDDRDSYTVRATEATTCTANRIQRVPVSDDLAGKVRVFRADGHTVFGNDEPMQTAVKGYLHAELTKLGQHRDLRYVLSYEDPSSLSEFIQVCIHQETGPDFYVVEEEVQQALQGTEWAYIGSGALSDIETPAGHAEDFVFMLCSGSFSQSRMEITIPVHLRYQVPSKGALQGDDRGQYRVVELTQAVVSVQPSDSSHAPVPLLPGQVDSVTAFYPIAAGGEIRYVTWITLTFVGMVIVAVNGFALYSSIRNSTGVPGWLHHQLASIRGTWSSNSKFPGKGNRVGSN
eukprot:Clim_evm20s55 gene=Clim_evmTU20s55